MSESYAVIQIIYFGINMRLLTRKGLADFLGVSPWTLRSWIARGEIRPSLRGSGPGRRRYWTQGDAEAILRKLKAGNHNAS
jgi:DNA-binding transcriptional MerR regulator